MLVDSLEIDLSAIQTWDDFHDLMSESFGFPDFYGRNMDAWIDCLASLDEPGDGLTKVHVSRGKILVLKLIGVGQLKSINQEMYEALVECSAFVNWRRLEVGESAVVALSFRD